MDGDRVKINEICSSLTYMDLSKGKNKESTKLKSDTKNKKNKTTTRGKVKITKGLIYEIAQNQLKQRKFTSRIPAFPTKTQAGACNVS